MLRKFWTALSCLKTGYAAQKKLYIYCGSDDIAILMIANMQVINALELEIGLNQQNWEEQLIDYLRVNHLSTLPISLTFASSSTRFALLAPQQQWPDENIQQFLFAQLFKQKYPGFDIQQFDFISDQIIFDQPCIIIALPKALHQSLEKCKSTLHVVDVLPSVLCVWEYLKVLLPTEPILFYEDERCFRINHDQGYPTGIFALPKGFDSTAQNFLSFDVGQPSLTMYRSFGLNQSSEWHQYDPRHSLNFMRKESERL
ncbi:hypothetical protein [Aquirhabdus parva]|uniref:Uncharacterized protein n=1 Tax=Aquirhabdus parva TaxID=2283318 RepID=A0A345P2H9_9GAMM|nr:hypothetical protein [Aquirhabdus parva]AXI01488.1 hypothetical protein HYN46_00375 [Aquirhabdus parva]